MILKLINYAPAQTRFCYIPDLEYFEVKFGLILFKQKGSVGMCFDSETLEAKLLDILDTSPDCVSVLHSANEMEIRNVLKL